MSRYYVGIMDYRTRAVFTSPVPPVEKKYGRTYRMVIGPFRTKLGTEIMAKHGSGNPHLQHVYDAEKLAARGRQWLRARGFDV